MLKTMLQRLRACAKIRWKMWWILAPPMSFAGGASWIHMPSADIQLEKCRKMNRWCKCFVLFVTFSLVFSIVTKNRITSMWPTILIWFSPGADDHDLPRNPWSFAHNWRSNATWFAHVCTGKSSSEVQAFPVSWKIVVCRVSCDSEFFSFQIFFSVLGW